MRLLKMHIYKHIAKQHIINIIYIYMCDKIKMTEHSTNTAIISFQDGGVKTHRKARAQTHRRTQTQSKTTNKHTYPYLHTHTHTHTRPQLCVLKGL